ncbi:hypothetical protein PInf_018061 [Phytophthora infestans]|nr:hypothetical protein PInf_018061 [Phytophthora infestans]
MADIYCVRGSMWLNDGAMHAFSVFLQRYKSNATVTMPPLKKLPRKKPANVEPVLPEKKRLEICASVAVCQFVLVPVNFEGVHWGCLVIEGSSKVIHLYDSLNSAKNVKRLEGITSEVASAMQEVFQKSKPEGVLDVNLEIPASE